MVYVIPQMFVFYMIWMFSKTPNKFENISCQVVTMFSDITVINHNLWRWVRKLAEELFLMCQNLEMNEFFKDIDGEDGFFNFPAL